MPSSARRRVIVHYHLFKNAGSSVDEMLKASFPGRWAEWDKRDPNAKISARDMQEYILDHPDLLAVSSHQVVPPLPSRELAVYPIVFLRHPIDRAYSAYLFESQQQRGAGAQPRRFEDYVADQFRIRRKNTVEEFQVMRLANRSYDRFDPTADLDDEEVLRAAKAFVASLPLFGIVERFAESVAWMQRRWAPVFPDLKFEVFHANALQDPAATLGQKLAQLRQCTEPPVFRQLTLRNQLDLRLYEYALARFDMAAADAALAC